MNQHNLSPSLPMQLTPVEYEQLCASYFELEGWKVSATATTGDQGADVIADSRGVRVVVQCKQYSQPVGNVAVQEVIAAKVFYVADLAIVVSNAPFTRSATELAHKAGIELIHHTRLRAWARQHVNQAPHAGMKAEQLLAALNLHGFKTIKGTNGGFTIKTPAGPRHIGSEGAFIQYAETLLDVKL